MPVLGRTDEPWTFAHPNLWAQHPSLPTASKKQGADVLGRRLYASSAADSALYSANQKLLGLLGGGHSY